MNTKGDRLMITKGERLMITKGDRLRLISMYTTDYDTTPTRK